MKNGLGAKNLTVPKLPSIGTPGTQHFSSSPIKIRPEHIRIIKEALKKKIGKFQLPSLGALGFSMGVKK